MKQLIRTSYVVVLGKLWMPRADASLRVNLSDYDIENIRGYSNRDADDSDVPNLPLTREGVALWLDTHAGDFSEVTDFSASIEDPRDDATVTFDWSSEDSEMAYNDTLGDWD